MSESRIDGGNDMGSNNDDVQRFHHQDAISRVLYALREARIKYVLWGSAASVHHGGVWLWKRQDYEILIKDWPDGPQIRQAIDVVTARCSDDWIFDHRFDYSTWTVADGDGPPRNPMWKFKYKDGSTVEDWGIVFGSSARSHLLSRHVNDLENGHGVPGSIKDGDFIPYDGTEMSLWVFPTLKNHVESLLFVWAAAQRNSALVELADLVTRRRLDSNWADSVGLEASKVRRTRPDGSIWPSMWEIWEEIISSSGGVSVRD